VHHGAEADSANGFEWGVVHLQNYVTEGAIAFLQANPNIFEMVCPEAMFISVFPFKASRGDRQRVITDQHRFNASRTELDTKSSLSAPNRFLSIVLIHVPLP
jgi:hypothetical protein